MQIKRIEPNDTPVIRFCCEEMYSQLVGAVEGPYFIDEQGLLNGRISKRVINFCPFCGEKVRHG